ncbi:MAG: glycine cleavage system protein T [Anaerolineae bacterium]
MTMDALHQSQGAVLAADGIPLHYGDLKAEYHAALEQVVLMDRSHEGCIENSGRDRLELIQRISTNDVLHMSVGEGRPTLFTNPNGRIIDRLMIYDRDETALITTEPGRSEAVKNYLQHQIFFRDDVRIRDLSSNSKLFTLHGPAADTVVQLLTGATLQTTGFWVISATIDSESILFAQRKALCGGHWAVIAPTHVAEMVWNSILEAGKTNQIRQAGSLTYNVLRIRAGRPAAGRELSQDYIPLEAGLWDEVSFKKGCYTGQEIIARMESRNRLAKTMVQIRLNQMVDAPADLYFDNTIVGTLTSSVVSPDNEIFGIGFVKTNVAQTKQLLTVGAARIQATISALAGAQPPMLQQQND